MLARGRPKLRREIGEVRELTREDIAGLERPKLPAFKKMRDSYHAVAKLVALGLRPGEVAFHSGYGRQRVTQLLGDPAFQGIVEEYRQNGNEDYRDATMEYYKLVSANRIIAARLINDKIVDADADDFSVRDLVTIHADSADRTGYGRHSVHEHKMDLSEALRRAIDASNKVLEQKVIDVTPKVVDAE